MVRSIEFIGLPGAGKTTIANVLRTELEALGFRVYSARELFRQKVCDQFGLGWSQRLQFKIETHSRNRLQGLTRTLRKELFDDFAKNNHEYVELCRKLIRDLPYQEDFKERLRRWLEEEGAGWTLFEKMNDQKMIYLNDEGFLHRGLRYFANNYYCAASIDRYVKSCPRHHMICYIEESLDNCLQRRLIGQAPTFKSIGVVNINKKKAIMSEYHNVLISFLNCFHDFSIFYTSIRNSHSQLFKCNLKKIIYMFED